MIHKILFSLFVSFWILGIGQGYVLQGQETTMVEIKAEFTIRNRLDIPAMTEKAGYKDRGEFLSVLEKITGNYNWDRDVKKGDIFVIPSKLAPIKIIEEETEEKSALALGESESIPEKVYSPINGLSNNEPIIIIIKIDVNK